MMSHKHEQIFFLLTTYICNDSLNASSLLELGGSDIPQLQTVICLFTTKFAQMSIEEVKATLQTCP